MSRIDELIEQLCPDGVRFARIDELFDIRGGYTPSRSNARFWSDGTIPWFRMEDIREFGRVLTQASQHVNESALKSSGLMPKGSIIVATSATIGEHAILGVSGLCNQRFTCLTKKPAFTEQLDDKFLYYYCFVLDEFCKNNLTQGSFASVSMPAFKSFQFPIPPMEIQEEIVRILDSFTELEAELEAELKMRQSQYAHYRNQLLSDEGLWKLSGEKVKHLHIENVCTSICSGGTPSTKHAEYYTDGTIPWVRTQDVDYREIEDSSAHITEMGLLHSAAKWIPTGCVIVAMYGATAAKVAMNTTPVTTNQACCNLAIDNTKALPRYVYHWLACHYEDLKSLGEGSQANISGKKVRNYPIDVPPLNAQKQIVDILDKFDALVNDLSSGIPAEIEARRKQYEYYRDKLLTFKEKPGD